MELEESRSETDSEVWGLMYYVLNILPPLTAPDTIFIFMQQQCSGYAGLSPRSLITWISTLPSADLKFGK